MIAAIFVMYVKTYVLKAHRRECVRMAKNVNRLKEYAVNKGNVVVPANVRRGKKNAQAYVLRKMIVALLVKTVLSVLKDYA
jgi:hypothetical protein